MADPKAEPMTDEQFLSYVETHSQTPRHLFSRDHYVRLMELSGHRVEDSTDWVDMDYEFVRPYIEHARTRLRPLAAKVEPLPIQNDSLGIGAMVIEDFRQRIQFGKNKYGTVLQANNGRDALVDAYQEQIDFLMYCRQEIEERHIFRQAIAKLFRDHGFLMPETRYDTFEQLKRDMDRALADAERTAKARDVLYRERKGEVWIWSSGNLEDGDNVETITCPILIQPETLKKILRAEQEAQALALNLPIPMLLFCPECGKQHVDKEQEICRKVVSSAVPGCYCLRGLGHPGSCSAGPPSDRWKNPPHKSHLCEFCGVIWRPAEVNTTGVVDIPRGEKDTWLGLSKADRAALPPWMYEVGVEGDLFRLHRQNEECSVAGCVKVVNTMKPGTKARLHDSKGKLATLAHDWPQGEVVHIWCEQRQGWWRPHGHGYTDDENQRGFFAFKDAYQRCGDAGKEKGISFVVADLTK